MFPGAFSHRDREIWSRSDLIALELQPNTMPIIAGDVQGGMATLQLANKAKLYLHQVDNKWLVLYLAHPQAESK
jgi:hypothetical protein